MKKKYNKRPINMRRSWLFIGGADEKKLNLAASSNADVCIIDLEDFCAPINRKYARELIPEIITKWKDNNILSAVRINPLETKDGKLDLEKAVSAKADAILLPKTRYRNQIIALNKNVRMYEKKYKISNYTIEIIPNIEDAIGYKNIDKI